MSFNAVGRHDVVVAREDNLFAAVPQFRCVVDQSLEPRQLVIELRPRLRIAVRQIDRSDDDAVDRRFQIPAVSVVRVVRQPAPSFDWAEHLSQGSRRR